MVPGNRIRVARVSIVPVRCRCGPAHETQAIYQAIDQEATMYKQGDQVVETAVEARQGFLDRPVFVVLVVSCVLAIGAVAAAYFGAFGMA